MFVESESTMQEFLRDISLSIFSRMRKAYPADAIEAVSREFSKLDWDPVAREIRHGWGVHAFVSDSYVNYEYVLSVLFVNLLGPLNRMSMQGIPDRAKFIHIYFRALDRVLNTAAGSRQFLSLAQRLMKEEAA